MPAFSFYKQAELDQSLDLVRQYRPFLAELIVEANGHITSGPRYAVFARAKYKKKWPWSKSEINDLFIELLWGEVERGEMQVLNFDVSSYESCLLGFLNGVYAMQQQLPETAWSKFMASLNEIDDLETKSFLGSVERYRKIYLNANKSA